MRARRPTERRPDPGGVNPANDDVFADQRMVRIREHKDHIIAVTNMAGHRRLGRNPIPPAASEVTVTAVYDRLWLRSSSHPGGRKETMCPAGSPGAGDVDGYQRGGETGGHRLRRARGRLSRPGHPDTGPY